MNHLWAPWRIQYILGPRESGCFLCKKPAESDDARNLLLWRSKNAFVILNAYPYNPGHLLIAPYRHTDDLGALGDETLLEMQQLLLRAQALLNRVMKPQGFNVGLNLGRVAGAGVLDHVHWHIVPRWEGDCNFMPVTASVRVIPQALDELYAELQKHSAAV
jgi:ATP adenylyltransferase